MIDLEPEVESDGQICHRIQSAEKKMDAIYALFQFIYLVVIIFVTTSILLFL